MKTAARISSNRFAIAAIALLLAAPGCSRSNFRIELEKSAPVLSNLRVSASSDTVTLSAPSFQNEGTPKATVEAYYAVSGVMGDDAPDVSLGERWEISLSEDTTLSRLAANTAYQIVVVAENELGRSMKSTIATTYGTAPKIKDISPSSTSSSITVGWPSFEIAGTPSPKVTAYIAKKSNSAAMSIVDSAYPAAVTVSNAEYSEVIPASDPSLGDSTDSVTFDGLDPDTAYSVIVIAANAIGYSPSSAEAVTGIVAPTISDFTLDGITASGVSVSSIDMGTVGAGTVVVTGYVTAGNAVVEDGWLSSPLKTVTPFAAGTQIDGLDANTSYVLYIVASNSEGSAWKGKTFSTAMVSPVLSSILSLCSTGSSITVGMPVFSTAPNPALTSLKAYIYKPGDVVTFSGEVPFVDGSEATSVSLLWKGNVRGCTFSGLEGNTAYTVRVVAVNPAGISSAVGSISTTMTPPVLAPLSVSVSGGTVSVAPTLAYPGNPAVTSVDVYIETALSITGSSVSGAAAAAIAPGFTSSQGPYSPGESVTVVVVAQNTAGYSIKTAEVKIPSGSDPSFIWLALNGVYGTISASSIAVNAPFIASLQPVVTYGVPSGTTVTYQSSTFDSGSTLGFSGPVSLETYLSGLITYNVALTSYGRVSTPVNPGLSSPYGLTTDGVNIYVLDRNEIHRIPEATMSGSVIAGGSSGYADGDGAAAKFYGANGIVYSEGYLYVADTWNNRIRRVMTSAPYTVTTLAGSGTAALSDGTGAAASFNRPYGIAAGGEGILYVADTENNVIRRVSTSTGVVTTLAGTGTAGTANGAFSDALFNNPGALVLVGSTLYVCDTGNHRIRALALDAETVTTFAGSSAGYVDDVGTAAQFCKLRGITSDGTNLFVTDADSAATNYDGSNPVDDNAKIRKIFIGGARVRTVAGSAVSGTGDGTGASASFYDLFGIVYLNNALYVTDPAKNMIRKIE